MTTSKEAQQRIERIVYIFPEVLKRMFKGMAECESDISIAQKKVLHTLGFHGQVTMKELSAVIGVEMSSATVLVDALVESGLVERQRDEKDRRIVKVNLTKKGQDHFKKLKEQLKEHLARILAKMTEAKQKGLVDSFEQLYKALHEVNV